jgi:acetyl-CoA carboxylase carboxyltransferase component
VPGLIEPLAPRFPIEDVLSIVNPDIRKPFDMHEVLLRIVDDSRLAVFKPKYGPNMITASAHIMGKIKSFGFRSHVLILSYLGFPVGIIANQLSVINPNEAAKATQFIRTCNQQ